MWRSFRSDEAGFSAAMLVLAFACMTPACRAEKEFAMRQPIEMGPWTFEVQSATERDESRGGRQVKIVSIELKLHNYKERHEKPFDDFLNGHTPSSIMAFPHLELEDASGAQFDGWLVPLTGGSLRSSLWRAEFPLVPSSTSDGNTADLAAKYLDTRLSDLRIAIDNPDRRGGQAERVLVPLH